MIKVFEIISIIEKLNPPSSGENPFLIMYILADSVSIFKIMILIASI
jgi:hypothetical protein